MQKLEAEITATETKIEELAQACSRLQKAEDVGEIQRLSIEYASAQPP
jgi:hypothetical protein